MVDINLLPKEAVVGTKKRLGITLKMPKIIATPLIVGVISALLLCQVLISLLAITQRNRLIKLSAEFTEVSPLEKVAEVLKKQADELNRKLSVIESLTSDSLIWSKKFYDLSGAVIEGVWLTSLSLNVEAPKGGADAQSKSRQTLVLKGSVVSPSPGGETAIVGKFIESLRSNRGFFDDFDDIKVSSIQSKRLGEIEVMDFTIICYFKLGRRYFEKLEAGNI